MSRVAVQVEGLSKRYGDVVAVEHVSFTVAQGEIFGLLGPNGAGKTTVLECLETLRRPDAGRLRVLGMDPRNDARALRAEIGVQLQVGTLPDRITVREALDLFASLYRGVAQPTWLVRELALEERLDAAFATLSGGERQRLLIALALVHQPRLVFLDELTTALDAHARRRLWALVRTVRARGTTVVLTTHAIGDAARLCDRVAIMSRGRIVAMDAPQRLCDRSGPALRLVFDADESVDMAAVRALAGVRQVDRDGQRLVATPASDASTDTVMAALRAMGVRGLGAERATLEDVFLRLTTEEPSEE
jgi:ABC-2 type transport system ATP-binding protein